MHGYRATGNPERTARSGPAPGVVVPVLPLERISASKRAANREKDRVVLPVLEDTLAALGRAPPRTADRAPKVRGGKVPGRGTGKRGRT